MHSTLSYFNRVTAISVWLVVLNFASSAQAGKRPKFEYCGDQITVRVEVDDFESGREKAIQEWKNFVLKVHKKSADGSDFTWGVRRQMFWDNLQSELREYLAHLAGHFMRPLCGGASAWFRVSVV